MQKNQGSNSKDEKVIIRFDANNQRPKSRDSFQDTHCGL